MTHPLPPHQDQHSAHTVDPHMLSPSDAAALDALADAGFAASHGSTDAVRTDRVVSLLSLLDLPLEPSHAQRELLIDVTLARVNQAAQLGLTHGADAPPLTLDDQRAFDAFVEAGYDVTGVNEESARRAGRIDRLLSLVGVVSGEPLAQGELVERTLATVDAEVRKEEQRLRFEPDLQREQGRGRRGFQFADVVAAAAILLIGGAVLTPAMSMLRDYASRSGCASNMQAAGMGFASYAGDYKDSFPLASDSRPGNSWWQVGNPDHSNSANLYTIARAGYVRTIQLDCSGNTLADRHDVTPTNSEKRDWARFEDVSYSFQNLFSAQRPTWTNQQRMAVMSDRSPVTLRARKRQLINPYANSPNHGERGQSVLFNDGSTRWTTSPVLGGVGGSGANPAGEAGDNLWLPRSIEVRLTAQGRPTQAEPIKGVESPDGKDDVFVGP